MYDIKIVKPELWDFLPIVVVPDDEVVPLAVVDGADVEPAVDVGVSADVDDEGSSQDTVAESARSTSLKQ